MNKDSLTDKVLRHKALLEAYRSIFRDLLAGNGVLAILALGIKYFFPPQDIPDYLFLFIIMASMAVVAIWLCLTIYLSLIELESQYGVFKKGWFLYGYVITLTTSLSLIFVLLGAK